MSTVSQLPASTRRLGNPSGNGAYSISEDSNNRTEQYSFACAWEDREAFRTVLVGLPQTFTIGGVSVTRNVSLQSPITPALYAVSYDMKGQGKANTSAGRPYNTAIFTITFAYPTIGSGGADSPYYSLSEQGSTRSITVPNSRYVFSNGEILDSGIALIHPGVSFVFTIFQLNNVATFRSTAIGLLASPVNSAALTIGGLSIPAGNALFETYGIESTTSTLGVQQSQANITIN